MGFIAHHGFPTFQETFLWPVVSSLLWEPFGEATRKCVLSSQCKKDFMPPRSNLGGFFAMFAAVRRIKAESVLIWDSAGPS